MNRIGRLRLVPIVISSVCLVLVAACTGPKVPTLVSWPNPRPASLLIRDVHVLDVVAGILGDSVDLFVENGRIAAITPTGKFPSDRAKIAHIIEGEGGTLLPGLIDLHGHVTSSSTPSWARAPGNPELNLRAFVYAGVTTVFDPSDSSGHAFERRARVAAGELLGPQIFTVGPLLTVPGGHPLAMLEVLAPAWIAWYIAPSVATPIPDEATVNRVVDRIAAEGADALKIVMDQIPLDSARMSPERAAQIVERGRLHGLRTVVHIGTTEDAIDSARAGVALWVHGVYKERIPDDQIAVLAGFGIPMVTTSEVFDSYGRMRRGPRIATRLEIETVPAETLASFYPIPEDLDLGAIESWIELMEATREIRLDNVARLHRAGVTILAGSDVQAGIFPGASLHRELRTLVEAGFTPCEAIRAATLDSARFLTQKDDPDFGSVRVGKRADLLLVDGDPSRDIGALELIRAVVLNGVPVDRTPIARDDGAAREQSRETSRQEIR